MTRSRVHAFDSRSLRILLILAGLALVVRLLPLLRSGDSWTILDDSNEYLALVHGLHAGCGLARMVDGTCKSPELLRLPGYPVFAAMMPNLRWVIAVQAFVATATCLSIGLFTFSQWGIAAGVIAETILALDVPSIVASSTIMSDCIFEAVLAFAVVLQLLVILDGSAGRRSIATVLLGSIILAYGVMLRAVAIILPIFAAVPFMMLPRITMRRRLVLSGMAISIPLTAILGWSTRNYIRTGRYTFNTEAAYTLYYFNTAGVLWLVNNGNLTQLQDQLARDVGTNSPDEFVTADQQREMVRRSLKVFIEHPLATAAMSLRCFLWLALVPDRANLNALLRTHARSTEFLLASQNLAPRIRESLHSPLLTAFLAFQFLLVVFTWIGVALTLLHLRSRSPTETAIILIPLAFALLMMFAGAGPGEVARFRMPSMPFLAMLAGIGWSEAAVRRAHARSSIQIAANLPLYSTLRG